MDKQQLKALLEPYNPWWKAESRWEESLPDYRRPAVREVLSDLRELPQVISITGPRRVGKTTAVKHVIAHLIRRQGVEPRRILYFSFDDPAVFASVEVQRVMLHTELDISWFSVMV